MTHFPRPPLLGIRPHKGSDYESQLSRHRTKQRRLSCILTPPSSENDSLFRRERKPSHRRLPESCSWQGKELSCPGCPKGHGGTFQPLCAGCLRGFWGENDPERSSGGRNQGTATGSESWCLYCGARTKLCYIKRKNSLVGVGKELNTPKRASLGKHSFFPAIP